MDDAPHPKVIKHPKVIVNQVELFLDNSSYIRHVKKFFMGFGETFYRLSGGFRTKDVK